MRRPFDGTTVKLGLEPPGSGFLWTAVQQLSRCIEMALGLLVVLRVSLSGRTGMRRAAAGASRLLHGHVSVGRTQACQAAAAFVKPEAELLRFCRSDSRGFFGESTATGPIGFP